MLARMLANLVVLVSSIHQATRSLAAFTSEPFIEVLITQISLEQNNLFRR